ncbi:MAG: 5-formyltetrahydrofolate cyclo-ligase, partial [Treponema sp.]|nr:5-formyltetrahydrofolate cyclo-ligase [Treponema sp.]
REIDTLPLIRGALAEGKRLFAPRVEGEDLVFYRLSRAGGLPKGKFGIREPEADRALTAEDFPVLAITPGTAFDRQGGRLGRGRGYYDRFFSALDAGILPGGKAGSGGLPFTACGFCMKTQLVKKVPVESRDRRMDAVLTENALLPGPLREK